MCIKRCWMMPCHDHRVLNSLFSSHQKMFITRSLRHPRGGPFASECSIFAPKTRVINSALLMYQAGVAEPRAHRLSIFAPKIQVINTMVHYCEKLMGVVVFAKVQGQVKVESPRALKGPRTFRLCKSVDLCKKLLLP